MAGIYTEKTLMAECVEKGYSSAICPSTSDQDYVNRIKIGNITWLIVIDGHGEHFEPIDSEDLVSWLKNYSWFKFLNTINEENPINKLEEEIDKNYSSTSGIGATISLVRIIDDTKITVWWRGDSYIKVFEDDELIGGSEIISITMEEEKERLKKEKIKYTLEKSWRPSVLSETEITMVPSFYINFKAKSKSRSTKLINKINMSQCIGHDNMCGKTDNRRDYDIDVKKKYRIIGASDGLWDVFMERDNEILVNKDIKAIDLLDVALKRWEQEWDYIWGGINIGKQKLDKRDDISCIVYDL